MRYKWIFVLLLLAQSVAIEAVKPAYLNAFERSKDRTGWAQLSQGNTGTCTWKIGTATSYDGTHSLYLTQDGGTTPSYPDNGPTDQLIYRSIPLTHGTYAITWVYKARGGYGDYLTMSLSETQPTQASDPDNRFYTYPTILQHQYFHDVNPWLVEHPMWTAVCDTFQLYSDGNVYLSFLWHTNGDGIVNNPGACIDFIQITPIGDPFDCSAQPLLLHQERQGNAATFIWSGVASEYEVEYFIYDDPTTRVVDYVTQSQYTVHCDAIQEGVYTFRVRSICGQDTSAWTMLDYQLLYDVSKHCTDYLNFYDPDVTAQYGHYYDPYNTIGVVDHGYWSEQSRITRHYIPGETDPRTLNLLTTTPDDQVASVRLGNWGANAQAEAVTYTLPITEDDAVLYLKYAIVLQDPNHTAAEQPHFTLELLDQQGQLVDSCLFEDFTATSNMTGWQTNNTELIPIIWKDWTEVAMNMQAYIGQTLQVRLTTKDCANGEHYGYSYFTLACSSGQVRGLQCGEKPDTLRAAPGFYYRWYRKHDTPKVILSRDQTYIIENSLTDTATYCVDLIRMTDTTCYYTIEISSLAYEPRAAFSTEWQVRNCESFVQLHDSSYIVGYAYDEQGKKIEIERDSTNQIYYAWECVSSLGIQTSDEPNPRFRLPNAAENVQITLTTSMEDGCENIKTITYPAPPVLPQRTEVTYRICEGDSILYKNFVLKNSGVFIDTLQSQYGCDSLHIINIRYIQTDTIHHYDSICESQFPDGGLYWDLADLYMPSEGTYRHTVLARGGCDSVVHVMHLHLLRNLKMELDTTTQTICIGSGDYILPYKKLAGETSNYSLFFSDEAHSKGFYDRINIPIRDTATIHIPINQDAWAGYYDANLVVYNRHCDSIVFPLHMILYYDAESVITQRWNDFLSVRKTAYDKYGGFTDYQWYENGAALDGQTSSQLYLPESGLLPNGEYWVEMTRLTDGVRIRSCSFTPTLQPNTQTLSITPGIIPTATPVQMRINVAESGWLSIYHSSGNILLQRSIAAGETFINPPTRAGLYIVVFRSDSGRVENAKIIVE